MQQKTIPLATALAFLAATTPVFAQPSLLPATLATPGASESLLLPQAAIDRSPVIFLGTGTDPATGKTVEGYAFVHYKNTPNHQAGSKGGRGGTSKCYSYLAKGAKWKTVEPWVMNSANAEGLDPSTLFNLQSAALAKWEDAADGLIGNGSGANIVGEGTQSDAALLADTASPDGLNEVYFGDVSASGAIAVTIVWGIFSGPIFGRELVEWDQIYDQADFDWSAAAGGVSGKMDFDNIATHEDGHAVGMGHPDDSCGEETMYRFSALGEIKKRGLNAGDIAGLNALY